MNWLVVALVVAVLLLLAYGWWKIRPVYSPNCFVSSGHWPLIGHTATIAMHTDDYLEQNLLHARECGFKTHQMVISYQVR